MENLKLFKIRAIKFLGTKLFALEKFQMGVPNTGLSDIPFEFKNLHQILIRFKELMSEIISKIDFFKNN